jgi:hypothetical protein
LLPSRPPAATGAGDVLCILKLSSITVILAFLALAGTSGIELPASDPDDAGLKLPLEPDMGLSEPSVGGAALAFLGT